MQKRKKRKHYAVRRSRQRSSRCSSFPMTVCIKVWQHLHHHARLSVTMSPICMISLWHLVDVHGVKLAIQLMMVPNSARPHNNCSSHNPCMQQSITGAVSFAVQYWWGSIVVAFGFKSGHCSLFLGCLSCVQSLDVIIPCSACTSPTTCKPATSIPSQISAPPYIPSTLTTTTTTTPTPSIPINRPRNS